MMRVSSTCFQAWSDNERFFQTPEDSFPFKLKSITKVVVFAIGIFLPQYSPSNPFSCGTVRFQRITLPLKKTYLNSFLWLVINFLITFLSENAE